MACSGSLLTPPQSLPDGGSHTGTGNRVRWDDSRYGCRADAVLTVFDATSPAPTPAQVSEAMTIEVRDAQGNLMESERTALTDAGGGFFRSDPIPLKREAIADEGNGILEVNDGFTVEAIYSDSDAIAGTAIAVIDCRPNLLTSKFSLAGRPDADAVISGGCDGDFYMYAGEFVTFSAANCNESNRYRFT